MKALIAIACLLIGDTICAQSKGDSIMLDALNELRTKQHLHSLKWDTNIYSEAKGQVLDTSSADWDDDSIEALAGIWGEFICENVDFDGEVDAATYKLIAGMFLNAIINTPGEKEIIVNPRARLGACVIMAKTTYAKNPDKKSNIRQFLLWKISLVVGVSY